MTDQIERRSRFLPRFSLLTALLLTTIVGLGIVVVQLWREVGPLRAEVIQRRNEMGHVYIADREKAHAIGVDWDVDGIWRWRLFLPKYSRSSFCIRTYMGQHSAYESLTRDDLDTWLDACRTGQGRSYGSVGGVRSGESTFEIKLANEGDEWYLQEGKGAKEPIPTEFDEWLEDPQSRFVMSRVPYSHQMVYERGELIVLLCHQRMDEKSGLDGSDGDTIVVWIEEDR